MHPKLHDNRTTQQSMNKTIKPLLIWACPFTLCVIAGCATAPKQAPIPFTTQALAVTDGTKVPLPSSTEADTISRFERFSGDISADNITNNLSRIYAANIYFRDPFKEIHGIRDLQTYLLNDSDSVTLYKIDWQDVAKSSGDYYFRWVMTVKLKRDGHHKPPSQTCGISEIRFGADGKVIYEQDYFDAAAFLYERLPILGGEIRFIKKRL